MLERFVPSTPRESLVVMAKRKTNPKVWRAGTKSRAMVLERSQVASIMAASKIDQTASLEFHIPVIIKG